jgi:PAS domain S-box-containing protein
MKHKTTAKISLKLLCLEDSPKDAEIIHELLIDAGYDLSVDCVATKKEYAALLEANKYDVILSDFKLPGFDAFEALRLSMDVCPDVPFICISGSIGEEIAIELIKQGAIDYILKDRLVRLPLAIKRALDEAREKRSRKQTEEALRKSEYFFKESQRAGLIGSYHTDFIVGFWESSEVLDQIFGIDQNYNRNIQGWLEIVHPDDREGMNQYLLKEVISKRKPFDMEYRIIRKSDSAMRYVHGLGKVDFNSEGKILSMIGTIQDITERKRAEEKANQLAAIVQSSEDAIIGKTLDGIITSWNKGAEKIYGYTESETIGKPISFLIPHGKEDEMPKILDRIRLGNYIDHYETVRYSKDGRNIQVSLTISPIRNTAGKIIAASTIASDITERKRIEQELRNSEEKFRKSFMTSPDSININRLEDGLYVSVNKGFTRIMGYTEEELVGKTSIEKNIWYDPADRNKLIEGLKKDGIVENLIARFCTKNGAIKAGMMSACIIELDGIPHILSMTRDITEHMHIEEALQTSEEKYRSIFENIQDVYYEVLIDGTILEVSPSIQILSKGQYHRNELIGKLMFEFYPITIERQDLLSALMEHSSVTDFEITFKNRDGSHITCSTSAMVQFNAQGSPEKIMGTLRDITERKQIGEALRESQALYHSFIEQLPNAVFRKDREGRYVLVNSQFCKLKGLKKENFIGKKPIEVAASEIEKQGEQGHATKYGNYGVNAHELIMRTGKILEAEEEYPVMDGGKQYMHVVRMPVFDSQGTVIGTQGIMFDVTERRKIETTLAAERNLMYTLINVLPDRIFAKDINRKFILTNTAHLKALGVNSQEEVLGKTDDDFRAKELSDKHLIDDLKILQNGESIIGLEVKSISASGDIDWLLSNKIPLRDAQGNIVGLVGSSHNITERKRVEEALRESERTFATLISNLPGFVYRCANDHAWTMEFISEGCLAITGYAPEDFLQNKNLAYNDIIQEDYRETIWQKWQQLLSIREAFEDEYPIITRRGETRWVWERGQGVFTKEGHLLYLEGFITDITDRKRIEEKNAEQAHLLDIALDAIIVRDINDKLLFWNKAAENLYGWTYEEARSFDVHHLIVEEDWVAYNTSKNELLRSGVWEGELHQKTKDGRSIITFSRWTLVRDPQGEPSAQLIVTHNITENKKAEEALRNSNAFNELLLQTIPFAMDIVDEQGTILFLNDNMEKLLGNNATGQYCWSIYKDDKKQCLDCPLRKGIEIGRFEILESANVFGGRIFQINHIGIMYQEKKAMLEVFVDVTEQRALQNQLLQAQKIQSIGTLAGGIAHDFNNILGIILAYSSFIEKDGADKKKIKESSAAINKAVERGAALVRQILTFARKTDVSFQSLNIPEFIQEIISMLEETFPKVIEIKKNIEGTIPVINADPTQMHQALLNLCVNARDAMPNGGSLKITVEMVEQRKLREQFTAASNERYVCIAVSDTGTGIDPKNKHRIFDPFFTTKEKGKGTGLGLSVVYGVMQTHHGFVNVESAENRGTTFFLYLPVPLGEGLTQRQGDSDSSEIAGGTEKILLVEDEEMLRSFVQELLEIEGYYVYTAADGLEAINLYKIYKNEINLVLTDIGLPKMTGIEEFKKLREINPQVKILLASGFLEPETKSELLDAGAKGFIQKPYIPNEILKEIRKILDESKQ